MEKAIIYIRISTATQLKGNGLKRQRECCLAYCEEKGYEVEALYEDVCSGTKFNRPGLSKALDRCKQGDINVFVIEAFDRMARDEHVHAEIVARLEKTSTRRELADELARELQEKLQSLQDRHKQRDLDVVRILLANALETEDIQQKQWYIWEIARTLRLDIDTDADEGVMPHPSH